MKIWSRLSSLEPVDIHRLPVPLLESSKEGLHSHHLDEEAHALCRRRKGLRKLAKWWLALGIHLQSESFLLLHLELEHLGDNRQQQPGTRFS